MKNCSDLPFTLLSATVGFLAGSIGGGLWLGVPGIACGGILGAWAVMFLLRRSENKHDPSAE